MDDDPYNDIKTLHLAALMNNRGGVSPICAKKPKAINLKRESWTLAKSAVDCPKCLAAMGVSDPKDEAKRRRSARIAEIVDGT